MPSPALTIGQTVTHRVYANRGAGKVLTIGRTLLRSQLPKLYVAFERGFPIWCYPDDLVVVEPPPATRPPCRRELHVVR